MSLKVLLSYFDTPSAPNSVSRPSSCSFRNIWSGVKNSFPTCNTGADTTNTPCILSSAIHFADDISTSSYSTSFFVSHARTCGHRVQSFVVYNRTVRSSPWSSFGKKDDRSAMSDHPYCQRCYCYPERHYQSPYVGHVRTTTVPTSLLSSISSVQLAVPVLIYRRPYQNPRIPHKTLHFFSRAQYWFSFQSGLANSLFIRAVNRSSSFIFRTQFSYASG